MALVVGYDRHPASRAAVLFAGELAGALNVPVHIVHVVDTVDNPISGAPAGSAEAVEEGLTLSVSMSERLSMPSGCSGLITFWTVIR